MEYKYSIVAMKKALFGIYDFPANIYDTKPYVYCIYLFKNLDKRNKFLKFNTEKLGDKILLKTKVVDNKKLVYEKNWY